MRASTTDTYYRTTCSASRIINLVRMNVYVFSDSRAGKSIHYLRRARIKLLNLRRAGQWILRRTKSQRPVPFRFQPIWMTPLANTPLQRALPVLPSLLISVREESRALLHLFHQDRVRAKARACINPSARAVESFPRRQISATSRKRIW